MAAKPPKLFDLDAERELIAAALMDPLVVLAFPHVQSVTPDKFWDHRNRLLWSHIQGLHQDGKAVNLVTLCDALRRDGSDIDVEDLADLVSGIVTYTGADDHAQIILSWARQRDTEAVISRLGIAIGSDGRFDQALPEAIAELNNLATQGGGPASPADWPVMALVDAYAPRTPLVYVVENLFPLPSLSIVYGAPGCLKSMLLTDMAVAVAGGLPWLPSLPDARQPVPAMQTELVPVLWLDFDNGALKTHERIEALARARNLDAEATPFYYVSMPSPWLDATDKASVEGLIRLANEKAAGLIVIDNLGTVCGGADENSAAMIQVLARFRLLAERTGAAVVIVHHQRKTTGFNSRAGESLRGHSSIEAALDLAMLIEREEGGSTVTVQSTKTRGVDVLPFGAVFAYDHKPGTNELERAQFYGQAVTDNRKPARAQRAILEALEDADGALGKMALVRAAQTLCDDVGQRYYRDTIDLLTSEGTLVMTPGPRNSQLYELGES